MTLSISLTSSPIFLLDLFRGSEIGGRIDILFAVNCTKGAFVDIHVSDMCF